MRTSGSRWRITLLVGGTCVAVAVICVSAASRLLPRPAIVPVTQQAASEETGALLSQDEVIRFAKEGRFTGMTKAELIALCGEPVHTESTDYDYKAILGPCSDYAPASWWLLVRFNDGVVVETRIDCD